MTKLRSYYWFFTGFFNKYKKTIILSLLGGGVAVSLISFVYSRAPKPQTKTYEAIVGKYTPSQIPEQIKSRLGLGLTSVGDDLNARPGLATRWEISENGTVYRFFLDMNKKWSDNKTVKLEDLQFGIPDVTVNKIEPNIIEFVLPEPFSPFPIILSQPLIRDGRYTIEGATIKTIQLKGQYLNQVELSFLSKDFLYKFYDSYSQAVTAYKLGEVDVLSGLLDKPEVADWPNTEVDEVDKAELYAGVFYNTNNPILKDKSVRQALSYGIKDKEFGNRRVLSSININSWAYNTNVKTYDFDQSRAKELLSKALPSDSKTRIEIAAFPEFLNIAESIERDWEELGLEVDIKVIASEPSEFQVLVMSKETGADPDQYSFWHSTQDANITHLQSPKIDKLLEDGRQELVADERKLIYFDFQRTLSEESPVTFLFVPKSYNVTRK